MNAPALFTLTCNLLAERTLEFAQWAPGRTQRAAAESFQVGGKGINVSKMLARLGAPATALAFAGGAPGDECAAWLRARGFRCELFATAAPTRCGTVVRSRDGAVGETTFLGPDVPPDAPAVAAAAAYLDRQAAGGVLAVCGSIPGWAEPEFDPLRAALRRWAERGTLVADTYGPPLPWFAHEAGTALVKINADEYRALGDAGDPARSLEAAVAARPRTAWIVSDGPRALWLAGPGQPAVALAPPAVREVSATGSGDVLLAAVLYARHIRGLDLRAAAAFALPLAAANAAHPGVAEFPLPSAPEISK